MAERAREKASERQKRNNPTGVYEKVPDSGIWYVRYRSTSGKLIRKRIGTKTQAIRYQAKVSHLLTHDEGHVPESAKGAVKTAKELSDEAQQRRLNEAPKVTTVGDLCDLWLAKALADPDRKDKLNPPRQAKTIKERFGTTPAAELRRPEVRQWLDSMTHLKPASVNRLKAAFSSIYRLAVENEIVETNPIRDVKAKRVRNGVVRYLKPEEEERIRAVLQADIDEAAAEHGKLFTDYRTLPDGRRTARTRHRDRSQQIMRLQHRVYELDVSLGTGLRKSSQYGLTWGDIDFNRRSITARETKNGEDHTVPMIDDVFTALKALEAMTLSRKDREKGCTNPAPADAVFAIGDNKKWWEKTLKRAKVENYRWHDNRHTFCSRLAQAGASLKVIQEAAGHKTIQMSARYAHLHQQHLAEQMAVLNRVR